MSTVFLINRELIFTYYYQSIYIFYLYLINFGPTFFFPYSKIPPTKVNCMQLSFLLGFSCCDSFLVSLCLLIMVILKSIGHVQQLCTQVIYRCQATLIIHILLKDLKIKSMQDLLRHHFNSFIRDRQGRVGRVPDSNSNRIKAKPVCLMKLTRSIFLLHNERNLHQN